MMFLIQGVFLQSEAERESLVEQNLHKSTYHGMIEIYTDPAEESRLKGEMFDFYGAAWIFNIIISEQELLFTKRYSCSTNGLATFKYKFKRQDNFYVGECEELLPNGTSGEKRGTKCILTEVPDDFFIEPQ